jgi:hypothetical protein
MNEEKKFKGLKFRVLVVVTTTTKKNLIQFTT